MKKLFIRKHIPMIKLLIVVQSMFKLFRSLNKVKLIENGVWPKR